MRTDELTFMSKVLDDASRDKLKSLRGNSKETLYEELESTTFVGEASSFISLNAFMKQQGYTAGDKALIKQVIHDPDNIDELMRIYKEDKLC